MKRLLLLLLLVTGIPGLTQAQTIIPVVNGTATIDALTCGANAGGYGCSFKIAMTGTTSLVINNARGGQQLAIIFSDAGNYTLNWPVNVSSPPTVSSTTGLVQLQFDSTQGLWFTISGGGGGGLTYSGSVINTIPKSLSSSALTNSLETDNGTTMAYTGTGGYSAASFSTTGVNGGITGTEGTGAALTAGAGTDLLWPDSTAHQWKKNVNNGGALVIPGTSTTAATANDVIAYAANGWDDIDTSILYTNLNTAASNATAAKQLAVAGGANKALVYIDFPDVKIIPAANCTSTTAGGGWTTNSTLVAACGAALTTAHTNNLNGVLQGTPSVGTAVGYFDFELPGDWDTSVKPYIAVYYGSGENTTNTVIWTISTACTKQDGSIT